MIEIICTRDRLTKLEKERYARVIWIIVKLTQLITGSAIFEARIIIK